jgi:hypothetical protein
MSARLEKYLSSIRKNLDIETPDDDKIWKGIKSGLNSGRPGIRRMYDKTLLLSIRNIAATVIIIFSLGYITNDIINSRRSHSIINLQSISTDLGRRESEYKSLVTFKTDEVRSYSGSVDPVIKELFEEIAKLDIIYNSAMKDLKELGPNDKVINIIFDTYEQKIRLLELIIFETNKTKSHENVQKTIL